MYKVGIWAAFLLLFMAGFLHLYAQQSPFPGVPYNRGQDVSPTFDGWEKNPDGTFSMWFGYYNRNTEEALDLNVGPDNNLDLGNGDQGQPTHFYPGRRWWVFKVVVPKDWAKDKRLVWTLTNRGRTNQAKAWLQPEWEADKLLISADAAADRFLMVLGRPVSESIIAGNTAPVITGTPTATTTLPAAATLKVTVTDDGLPKPREGEKGSDGVVTRSVDGVRVRWILYRGPANANVRFDPEVTPTALYGKPLAAETKATFSAPGDYWIRAIASDVALFSFYDIKVTVKR
jgi:hypothetical protein